MSLKISSGGQKKGAPKHKNTFAFIPSKFNAKAMKIAAINIVGVCKRCNDILEWRQKMGKYKPLTQPKTCNGCSLRKIVHAYHTNCMDCAKSKQICAKCHTPTNSILNQVDPESEKKQRELDLVVSRMSERKRRAYRRKVENGDEIGAQVILDSMNNAGSSDFEEDDWSGSEVDSESK